MLLCYYTWLHARALCRYRDVGSGGSSHVPAKSRFTSSAIRRILLGHSASRFLLIEGLPQCCSALRDACAHTREAVLGLGELLLILQSLALSVLGFRTKAPALFDLEAFQLSVLLALLGHETGMLQTDIPPPGPAATSRKRGR